MFKSQKLPGSPGTFGSDHGGSEQTLKVILGIPEIFQAHQIVYKMMT